MTSKSAITPSFRGRTAWMWLGVRPIIRLASAPTARMAAGKGVDRDDRRLVQHDAAATHVDERVRGAEVDGHVATKEPEYPLRPLGRSGRGGRRSLNPFGHGIRGHSTGRALAAGNFATRETTSPVTSPDRLDRLRCRPGGRGAAWRSRWCSRGRGRSSPGMADAWIDAPGREGGDRRGLRRDGARSWSPVATTRPPSRPPSSCSRRCSRATWRRSGCCEARGLGGAVPVGVAGHSLGEFAALVAAGVAGAHRRARARRRRAAPRCSGPARTRPGTMTRAARRRRRDAEALCDEVRGDDVLVVANQNSPVQVVISGIDRRRSSGRGAREGAEDPCGPPERGGRVPLRADAAGRRGRSSRCSLASSSAPRVPDRRERHRRARDRRRTSSAQLVAMHVVSPVRWETGVRALAAAGATTFLEAGPGRRAHEAGEAGRARCEGCRGGIARGGRDRGRGLMIVRHRRRSVACIAPRGPISSAP